MARHFVCAALGVVTLLILLPASIAGPETEQPQFEAKLRGYLTMQTALREGREHLQRGNYLAAVNSLEREIQRAGGDKDYLFVLESAYRGYIRELQQAKADPAIVNKYVERLAILDPGSSLEQRKSNPPTLASNPPTLASLASAPSAPMKQPDPATTVRGAMDFSKVPAVTEYDPFSEANRAAPADAVALVTKADQEFRVKHYAAAAKLYQQAFNADPKTTAGATQKCWAYCKLNGVIEAMNQPTLSTAAKQELLKEVRQAMSMSPKLGSTYAKALIPRLEERMPLNNIPAVTERVEESAAVPPMRHLGKQGQWNVLETANFRILHNQPAEVAEKAAKIAEQTRTVMSTKWFNENGGAWSPRCDLYLHATGQDYSKATGVPAQSPGHSTIRSEGDHVLSRRVDIHCDDANWPVGVLPHETTHVVLAGRYGNSTVPRWADEGMAVLAEPRDRIERHLRNLPKHRDERTLFNVGKLMQMNDYPDPRYIGPFYAQSVSLVEYLSSLKGAPEYTAFLRDGLREGYEPALQKHFHINGYADLDRLWQNYAFRQLSASVP